MKRFTIDYKSSNKSINVNVEGFEEIETVHFCSMDAENSCEAVTKLIEAIGFDFDIVSIKEKEFSYA